MEIQMSDPKPITSVESHDTIVALLEGEPRGRLLDVPCGRGALGIRLARMDFEVHYCDIDAGLFELKAEKLAIVNLNTDRLPYPDGHFDYITCTNGLHRLYNSKMAICEFARCLAENGKLFISYPNYASLWRRIMFLLYGSLGQGVDRPAFLQVTKDPDAHFRCALTVPQILNTLEEFGFNNTQLFKARTEKLNWIALPLGVFIKIFTYVCSNQHVIRYRLREVNSADVLFGSREVFIRASRVNSGQRKDGAQLQRRAMTRRSYDQKK